MKMKIGRLVFRTVAVSMVCFLISLTLNKTAFAQDARYCPDPDKIFSGELYSEDDKPWSEFIVDPSFREGVLKKRYVTGEVSVNPLYDTVLRIKPNLNYYCIPGYSEGKIDKVTAEMLPEKLNIDTSLIVGKKKIKVVNTKVFDRTSEQDEQGRFIYEWRIKAWPNGIGSAVDLENLISAVKNVEPVDFELALPKEKIETVKIPTNFSLCVPLWGSGQHKMVYARGDVKQSLFSSLLNSVNFPVSELYNFVELVRIDGFLRIDPYKKYKLEFSHYIDLDLYDSSHAKLLLSDLIEKKRNGNYNIFVHNEAFINLNKKASSCGDGIKTFFLKGLNKNLEAFGISSVSEGIPNSSNMINIDLFMKDYGSIYKKEADFDSQPDKLVFSSLVLHEMSHAFAGLNDEYVYINRGSALTKGYYLRNCTDDPYKNYNIGKKLFGDLSHYGCVNQYLYRPSSFSIMNSLGEHPFFNVISCGYVISAIKGGKASDYWEECMNLDTIKPLKGDQELFYEFYSKTLFNEFVDFVKNINLAQAISANNETDQGNGYVIVESIDQNGKFSGDIYFDEGNDSITPPSNQTVIPDKDTVESGQTVRLNYSVPAKSLSARLRLNCPDGISGKVGNKDMCNQWLVFPTLPTETDVVFTNKSDWPQYVTTNFYIYYENDPNYAVGVSSQVKILPQVVSNIPAPTPAPILGDGLLSTLIDNSRKVFEPTLRRAVSIIIPAQITPPPAIFSPTPSPVTNSTVSVSPSPSQTIKPSSSTTPKPSATVAPYFPTPSSSPTPSPTEFRCNSSECAVAYCSSGTSVQLPLGKRGNYTYTTNSITYCSEPYSPFNQYPYTVSRTSVTNACSLSEVEAQRRADLAVTQYCLKPQSSPSPSASISPKPISTISPSPTIIVSPSPSTSVSTSPTPSSTVIPTPTTTSTPTPTVTITPTPTITVTPTPTVSPTPIVTPTTSPPSSTASPSSSPASTTSPPPASSPSSSPSTSPSASLDQNSLASVFEAIAEWLGW